MRQSLDLTVIGLVSEEKLIDLLLIALSSNTKKTMRRCRELLSCGVDPVAIMCQLTGLIVDIITGACQLSSLQTCKNTTAVQSLSEVELGRLQNALKILSDAEKQLPNSSERSTWFTSAILQLASINYPDIALSSSTRSSKNAEILFEEPLEMETGAAVLQCSSVPLLIQESDRPSALQTSTGQRSLHNHSSNQKTISNKLASDTFQINKFSAKRDNDTRNRYTGEGMRIFRCINTEKLDVVWQKCINRCRSETLRTLLAAHGKLVSVTSVEGVLIAYIVFVNGTVKSRAERFLSSITNSIEMVLKRNVEVRIGIVHEKFQKALNFMPESTITGNIGSARICSSDNFQRNPSINLLTNSDNPESLLKQKHVRDNNSSEDEGFLEAADLKMMESAYLQSTEKGEQTHLLRHSSTEKAFPMLQNGQTQSERKSPFVQSISLKHWQQELNNEIEELESNSSHLPRNLQLHKDAEWYNIPISPSLLHSNSLGGKFDNDGIGYDSGPVQNGICCWRINKSEKRKIKKGSHGRSKDGCVQCFMPPSS
ncbi:hypothetical protein HPP92_013455 [Vanilla planifolia]|uniref:DNA polymerase III gamma subunit domain-containing protein n=1 Tax=Vanilla planifolia TaxID=51239 RepID=A0A835QQ22_VANPL|nr:hypothetical protein HPP92_013455 [Vanilla planifolia]